MCIFRGMGFRGPYCFKHIFFMFHEIPDAEANAILVRDIIF